MRMTLRVLNSAERQLLERMLSAPAAGRHELLLQLEDSLVEPIDRNGSLRFVVDTNIIAPVERRIPVEAQCQDSDGMWIHALLHVVDGKVWELEIYKDDSSNVDKMPANTEWEILVL